MASKNGKAAEVEVWPIFPRKARLQLIVQSIEARDKLVKTGQLRKGDAICVQDAGGYFHYQGNGQWEPDEDVIAQADKEK